MVGMQFNTPCSKDHIVPSNPYERFMISILERLEKIETRMENIGKGLETVGSRLDSKYHVIYIKTSAIDPTSYIVIREVVGSECILGNDSIQIVASDSQFFAKIEQTMKKLNDNGIHTDNILIRPNLEINDESVLVSDKAYKLQAITNR